MKTTLDIADALFKEAKHVAREEGTTLRALVEAGLRHTLAERRRRPAAFTLKRVTVAGKGLAPPLQGQGWGAISEALYEGRGGKA